MTKTQDISGKELHYIESYVTAIITRVYWGKSGKRFESFFFSESFIGV